ncbi:MAG: hypothetical protein A2527_05445 [Candidatus Lambdaproteobacteria bacterium RIFOXYD2_FULL_50_16]|uniref:Glycosyltransferase 2-like domain-containing protein n=1 Tax=Candidatus Lambdaproteobacteria bacterium RIFOXYD2_FULL_50_16 TaxID=1817772 RepID=A0A1F6G936_9PROT|nr:MAG: hypothetical protein A2527_05445 [Candidatus Lambdaproteobacteria bacterium RIFOXYD2_FULL_50_16]
MISVIIASLNDKNSLLACLPSILAEAPFEVLIADGGSNDGTQEAVFGQASLISTLPGRGCQFNQAAAKAQGEVLLFLHADSILPTGWSGEITRLMAEPKILAGAFQFKTDFRSWWMPLLEFGVALRSKYFELPYGDQGLFLRRADFMRLGGYLEVPLMEDFEFSRRISRQGKIATSTLALITSGRRWQERGFWQVTKINLWIVALYLLGYPQEHLKSIYVSHKKP